MGGSAYVDEEYIDEFDNFYICHFTETNADGKVTDYASTEHYFQSKKTLKPESSDNIRLARTPMEAWQLGNLYPLRAGWEEMKNEVFFEANLLKYNQNSYLKNKLLNTKGEIVFPFSDSYWGRSIEQGDTGKNISGLILMTVRSYLKSDLDTFSRYAVQLNINKDKYLR